MLEYDHYGYPASRADARHYEPDPVAWPFPKHCEWSQIGMDINEAFPSKFLKAADLKGREVTVNIESTQLETMADGEHKPVVYFKGKTAGLVLNRINTNTIINNLGSPETDTWCGQNITIYPTKTDFAGRLVDCIRVKVREPEPPPQVHPPGDGVDVPAGGQPDDIPF